MLLNIFKDCFEHYRQKVQYHKNPSRMEIPGVCHEAFTREGMGECRVSTILCFHHLLKSQVQLNQGGADEENGSCDVSAKMMAAKSHNQKEHLYPQ